MGAHGEAGSATRLGRIGDRLRATVVLAVAAVCMVTGAAFPLRAQSARPLLVQTISSRPEYVTGEDVLVRITAPDDIGEGGLRFRLNGKEAQWADRSRPGDRRVRLALVRGLVIGRNVLDVLANGRSSRLRIEDHPVTGPVFSGMHVPFFDCQTEQSGLGAPSDRDCSVAPRIDYFYRTTGGVFRPLPAGSSPPADIARTTTIDGQSVPYIVRVESGTSDRAIYRIAVLDEPDGRARDADWRPGPGWNGRLVVSFGGGCGMHYGQGGNAIESVLSDVELSRGFAYAISSGLVNQVSCNPALQGETLEMLKEHFIKRFGPPKWTAGVGGSGGAIQQYTLAAMFPGLLDGIQPSATHADTQLQPPSDCKLLARVFARDPARWTKAKQAAVSGATLETCGEWVATFSENLNAVSAPVGADPLSRAVATAGGIVTLNPGPCGVPDARLVYDPVRNPKGLRCSLYDFQANLLGRAPGGAARRPLDNVGVQYGLAALKSGAISLEDFIALNEQAGGYDRDGAVVSRRTVGDPIAVANAYRTGLVLEGGGLGLVPIITQRGYMDLVPLGSGAAEHDRLSDLVVRTRLQRAYGSAANQIIWTASLKDAAKMRGQALDLMTRWLDAMAADPAPLSQEKVIRLKPAEATDACWSPEGERFVEVAALGTNRCNGYYPFHGSPRMVAGGPVTNDVLQCQLKPIDVSAYGVPVSAPDRRRLAAIFPSGVCDYARPSRNFAPIPQGRGYLAVAP